MKKLLCISLVVAMLLLSVLCFVACDSSSSSVSADAGEFIKDVAKIVTAPDAAGSLLSAEDAQLIADAFDESLSEDEMALAVKKAAWLLYDTANKSRTQNEGTSLMVQRSLGGNSLGRVYMNGFTLQNGDSWYYQLVSQAAQGEVGSLAWVANAMKSIAGNLQIAYTTDSKTFEYFYIMGNETQLDCSSNVFPYASYIIPEGEEPTTYDSFEAYQADRNCRVNQLELNNMGVCEELMTNCSVEHSTTEDGEGYYTVTFDIDCQNGDKALLEEFWKYSKLDLDIDAFPIKNTINAWRAELEVWDSGHAKAFRSYEDWSMVVTVVFDFPVDSTPSNEFVYVWNDDEIIDIISQDERADRIISANVFASDEDKISSCIAEYVAKAQNETTFVFDFFTLTIVLVACVVGAIIIVSIVLAILFKKGKLPKLAAAFERDKARRRAITEQNRQDRADKHERREAKKAEKHPAADSDETATIVLGDTSDEE